MAKTPSLNQLTELQKRMAQFEKTIDSFTSSVNRLTESFNQNAANAQKAVEAAKKAEEEKSDKAQSYIKSLQEEKELQEKIAKLKDNQADRTKEIYDKLVDIGLNENEREQIAKNIAQEEIDQLKNVQKIAALDRKKLSMTKEQLKAEEDLNETLTRQEAKRKSIIDSLIDPFTSGIKNQIESIPVVGKPLSKALGLDTLQDDLSKALHDKFFKKAASNAADVGKGISNSAAEAEALAASTEAAAGGMTSTTAAVAETAASTEAAAGGMAAFGTASLAALGPILLVAAAIAAVVAAFEAAMEIDQATTDIANNMNATRSESAALSENLSANGVLIKEQAKYAKMLSDEFGNFGKHLSSSIPRMRALQHNMQLGDDEIQNIAVAAALTGQSLSGSSKAASEFETSLMNVTKEYYEQQGVQLTQEELVTEFRANLQEIGSISKQNLALFGKSGKELQRQIMVVRKFGLSLDQVAKTMQTVLDIESSLESEMSANILLGKHMNLNAVRQASLFGNAEDVAREMNKVLADQNINLDSFNNMLPFQKKQLSAALGIQEDEIQAMLLKNKLGDDDLLQKIKAGQVTKEQLVATGKLTSEEAGQLIIAERRTSVQQDIDEVQAQLANTLKSNMSGLVGLIRGLANLGSAGAWWLGDTTKDTGPVMPEETGDLAINANGGPVVMSPRENAIFQGTRNDEVAMAPGILSSYSGNVKETSSMTQVNNSGIESLLIEQNKLLSSLIQATNQPVKINIGNKTIEEIDRISTLRKTYSTKVDNAYGTFG